MYLHRFSVKVVYKALSSCIGQQIKEAPHTISYQTHNIPFQQDIETSRGVLLNPKLIF